MTTTHNEASDILDRLYDVARDLRDLATVVRDDALDAAYIANDHDAEIDAHEDFLTALRDIDKIIEIADELLA